jgi:thymidylate synthase
MLLSFENINEMQLYLLELLKVSGDVVTTRGLKTLEMTPVYLRLNNPRKRCTTLKKRKWNFPFAIGELCWHMAGSNQLEFIEYYAKQWKNFSEDGKNIKNSCYGNKIFSKENGPSQWDKIVELFKKDMYTRRAVFDLYNSEEGIDYNLKDVSCTCSIQFLYRKSRLDATVYMRSNDVIWGLPYDIFFFTFLQEMLANELNVEIGVYNHLVGSLHLYERHFQLADEILDSHSYDDFLMNPILDANKLFTFLEVEKLIRIGTINHKYNIESLELSSFWKDLLEVLFFFRQKKLNFFDDLPTANPYFSLLTDFTKKSIS